MFFERSNPYNIHRNNTHRCFNSNPNPNANPTLALTLTFTPTLMLVPTAQNSPRPPTATLTHLVS